MEKMKRKSKGIIACFMAAVMILLGGITPELTGTSVVEAATVKSVKINETNFPDPVFRSVIAGADYDRNGDGVLSAKEISLTMNIYCENMGIKSIKGVEYFTELKGLWCKDNQIKTMDLSKNKELRGVWCSGNLFTSLDFTPNPKLLWVYCYDCKLKSLNVSNNPDMAFIECNTNPLTKLDVTHNPKLEHLTCGTCGLKSLDLSKNPILAHLDAFRNKFTKLDVSKNPKLKRLDIWENTGLGNVDISHNPGLQYYNCASNGVKSLDVSHNPELQKLICSYNSIKKLDVSKNPKLVYLDCAVNQISSLNLSKNPKLYFLQAFTNTFTKLDIGYNPFLIKTYKEGKKKAEYAVCKGHSWTISYGGDTSTGLDNIIFLCVDDVVKVSAKAKRTVTTEEKYSPLDPGVSEKDLVKRETVVRKLYEMAGSPGVKGLTSRFTDVKKGSSYEKALLWGEKHAICVGYPDSTSDTFGVGKWITRQDLLLMLMRYSEVMGYKRSIDFGRADDYMDYYDVDFEHWEAVTWSATWNILKMKGKEGAPKEEQRIDPFGRVTVSELNTTLNRLLQVNNVSGKVRAAADVSPEKPARAATVEKKLLKSKSDRDPKGSTYSLLRAKGVAKSASTVKLAWSKVKGATKYIIYGSKCGKKYSYKKLATVKGTSYTAKKLKKGTYYKFIVVAVRDAKALAESKPIHVVTAGGKKGNPVKVALTKKKLTLAAGKTATVKAVIKNGKKKPAVHRKIAWESDDLKVAKVSAKGKIIAVAKGTCVIYAYAQNGVCAKIKVTVK